MNTFRWPWTRSVTDAEIEESTRRLRVVKARAPEVEKLAVEAKEIIRKNHMGENIHRALGGRP